MAKELIAEVEERLSPGNLQKADQLIRQWKPKQPVFKAYIDPGEQGLVDSVIDTRTILLSDSTIIGLLGLSTSGVDSMMATEALLCLRGTLTGQKIIFKFDRQAIIDSTNIQAYVFIDEICINEQLLRRGLARVDIMTTFSGKENFLALEWKARQRKIGLWKTE